MSKLYPVATEKGSLRLQYIIAASIVVSILVLGSILASFYFQHVTSRNTTSLNLRNNISNHIDELSHSIWQADKSLYVLLSHSEETYNEKIMTRFNTVVDKLNIILAVKNIETTRLFSKIKQLENSCQLLNIEVTTLLKLRKNINWLYPMLPFIDKTMRESNRLFDSAINIAIEETLKSEKYALVSQAFGLLDEVRHLWQLKILEFRAMLVTFAGLNIQDPAHDNNINNYHALIEKKLNSLIVLGKKGLLGFETESSLKTMLYRSRQWNKDYNELLKIKETNIWRSDVHYIQNKIQPLQEQVFYDLSEIEKSISEWSLENSKLIEKAAKQINIELWVLTGLAVLFVFLIYKTIDQSLLLPIAQIAKSITSKKNMADELTLTDGGSEEIHVLVNAFNDMRDQINHRQMVLEFQAMHDSLTGLPNRALLQDRMEQGIQIALRNKTEMALLLLDLDRFKDINDTLGHPAGDRVLREISNRLESCLRASDTVARLGGDEFAIITNYNSKEQIEAFVKRVVKDVERVIHIDEQNLSVGVSIGISSFPRDGNNVDTLIRRADMAMYSAKRDNRDHEFYDNNKDYHSPENLALLSDLKTELKKPADQVQLFFQPIVNLITFDVISVEALIRWNHPTQGMLPADHIIRMAEQTGLINQLTYWVINESINQYLKWNNTEIRISINLSVWNLQDPDLVPYINNIIKENNINPEMLAFEITESAVMNDPVTAKEVLNGLQEMGVGLAIDDYGTGLSSLAYLKLLPVICLKIDKSFVLEMLENDNDSIIIHSTIDMAHNLGLTVVAEGIENQDTLLKLRNLKCNFGQGFHIAEPMSSDELMAWLLDYNPVDVV